MGVIDDNWEYCINSFRNESTKEFETRVSHINDEVVQLCGFKVQKFDSSDISPNDDEELKNLIEKNKQLRNEIEKKIEVLNKQKNTYENFKQDQKLLSQEIKDTHEAFLMAKKYYKKYLNMYYTIESRDDHKETIYLQFFTETKKESEKYSIRLLRDTKTEHYQLLEMNPQLNSMEELKKALLETNDVPTILSNIRHAFLKMKSKNS